MSDSDSSSSDSDSDSSYYSDDVQDIVDGDADSNAGSKVVEDEDTINSDISKILSMNEGSEKTGKIKEMWAKLLKIATERNEKKCDDFLNKQKNEDFSHCPRSIDTDMQELCAEKKFPPPQLIKDKAIYVQDLGNKEISDKKKNAECAFLELS